MRKILFPLLPLLMLLVGATQLWGQGSPQGSQPKNGVRVDTLIERESGLRLRCYSPSYSNSQSLKVRLVTGNMPQADEQNVMICVEAASTTKTQSKGFDHEDIVGVHVYDGEYNYGAKDNHNTGAFVYYRKEKSPYWKFIKGSWECEPAGSIDINDPLRRNHSWDGDMEDASDHHGMGFAQKMLLYDGERLPNISDLGAKGSHRVLVERKGQLQVIETIDPMTLDQFVKLLLKLKVTHALCLDMSTGRDYGFYHDMKGDSHPISKKNSKAYNTNWLCFVAPAYGGVKSAQEKIEEEDVLPPIIRRAPRDPNLERRCFVKTDTTKNRQLVFFTPIYSSQSKRVKARLVCDTMPNCDNERFILVAEAAFTEVEDSRHFRHDYVCGNHVVDGKFHLGAECKANTGVFIYYSDTSWTFKKTPSGQRRALLMEATKQPNSFGFEQIMLFQDGQQVIHGTPLKMTEYYRCLAQYEVPVLVNENGIQVEKKIKRLCVVESVNRIGFDDFISELKKAGVTDAIYMDMGSGWNHAYYRDKKGFLTILHKKRHDYCTNWIVFEMPKTVRSAPETKETK